MDSIPHYIIVAIFQASFIELHCTMYNLVPLHFAYVDALTQMHRAIMLGCTV